MGIFEQLAEMRAEEAKAVRAEGLAKGKAQGIAQAEKNKRLFVKTLLKDTNFSMQKIASLAAVSVYFVKKVKASLHAK